MRILLLLTAVCAAVSLHASALVIDTGDLSFNPHGERYEPVIEGYPLDARGEKIALPEKRFFFRRPVVKVAVLASVDITPPGKLAIGHPIYKIEPENLTPIRLEESVLNLPGPNSFHTTEFSGMRHGIPTYSFTFSPLVPLSGNRYRHIRRIRVTFGDAPTTPVTRSTDIDRSLLIITTNDIRSRSQKLSAFVAAKQQHGFTVDVATEDEFGGADLSGAEKALAVRSWLKGVRSKYRFLLIIASPVPGSRGIPMVAARKLMPQSASGGGGDYETIPTDTFYSELFAEWDSNDDGELGGPSDNKISYQYQLVVGRIPVYDPASGTLDSILQKTIDYMSDEPDAEYRRHILIPASIAYYKNQDGMGYPQMDGAYVADYIRDNYLTDGFDMKVMVEQDGLLPSEYTSFPALTYDALEEEFNTGHGIVFWQGHGLPTQSVRTVWSSDSNNDGIPASRELSSSTFVDSTMAQRVSQKYPGFIFEGSCLNGKVEVQNNLGYTMLAGPGIGVVAATRVTFGGISDEYQPERYQDVFAYGSLLTRAAIENDYPARMLYEKKADWSNWGTTSEIIKLELTYFGDPSLRLGAQQCTSDEECDDGLYCNGTEQCSNGFCGIKTPPPDCSGADTPCHMSICDESTDSCTTVPMDDGAACGDSSDKCVERYYCSDGECIADNPVDCSDIDSVCGSGACNPETGSCIIEPDESAAGTRCDDGDFCTVDDSCSVGECIGKERSCDQSEAPMCSRLYCSVPDQKCIPTQNRDLNGTDCVSLDGYKGYCDHGECFVPDGAPKAGDNNGGSGCSITVMPL